MAFRDTEARQMTSISLQSLLDPSRHQHLLQRAAELKDQKVANDMIHMPNPLQPNNVPERTPGLPHMTDRIPAAKAPLHPLRVVVAPRQWPASQLRLQRSQIQMYKCLSVCLQPFHTHHITACRHISPDTFLHLGICTLLHHHRLNLGCTRLQARVVIMVRLPALQLQLQLQVTSHNQVCRLFTMPHGISLLLWHTHRIQARHLI